MALDILTKGPSLDLTEENQLYDHFKAWRKRVGMLTNCMAPEERTPRIPLLLHKGLVRGDRPCTHRSSGSHRLDDATSTKCILDIIKGPSKSRINEILAATAFKQLVQCDLGLQEYIEK